MASEPVTCLQPQDQQEDESSQQFRFWTDGPKTITAAMIANSTMAICAHKGAA